MWPLLISCAALAVSAWVAVRAEWIRPRADWRLMVRFEAALINIGSAPATDIEVFPVVVSTSGQKTLTGTTVRAGEHADLFINFPLSYNGGTGRESYGPNFDSEGSQLVVTYRDTPRGRKLKKKILQIPEYMNRPPRI